MRNKQCQLRTGGLYAVLNSVTMATLDKTPAVSGQIANQGLFVGDREYEGAFRVPEPRVIMAVNGSLEIGRQLRRNFVIGSGPQVQPPP
jgi:hypothetical protein